MMRWMLTFSIVGLVVVIGVLGYRQLEAAKSPYDGCTHMWAFEPKDDITPYELAKIVKAISGGLGGTQRICETEKHLLPTDLRRHFVKIYPK